MFVGRGERLGQSAYVFAWVTLVWASGCTLPGAPGSRLSTDDRGGADLDADVSDASEKDHEARDEAAVDVGPMDEARLLDGALEERPSDVSDATDPTMTDGAKDTGECVAPGVMCGAMCVDPSANGTHCGACGNACVARANSVPLCVGGRCTPRCAPGFADCDGAEANGCEVNLNTSVSHCGACGSVCQARPNSTPACTAGACTFTCTPGYGDCDTMLANGCEVNGFTDPTHCGGCALACAAGQACIGGACVVGACTAPRVMCGSTCVDPSTDGAHCGACGNACSIGQTCVAGRCQCPAGQTLCGGTCTNLQTDARNCGTCGAACPTGASCVSGRCQCPSGQVACAGACVNTNASSDHCGRCGNSCGLSDACFNGTCGCGGRGQFCCWFRRCAPGLTCGTANCM